MESWRDVGRAGITRFVQITAAGFLASLLCACQHQKETIFLDSAWNRDYALNACEIYKKNLSVACIKTPEQMATELRLRLASAVSQSPACKGVTVTNKPLAERDLKDYENGWSLSFNVGIDGGDIDYSNSEWQIIDNKTVKRFAEGQFKDPVEAATRICTVATGRGGSVSP
jgi:hypothetical protein